MSYGFSHRGYRQGDEENTLIAFERAYQTGVRHFETDVRCTSDDVVYAFHDETVDRITQVAGRFNDLTEDQIGELRAGGQPLLPLRELIERFPDVTLNIDVKDQQVIAPLAKVIEQTQSHQQIALASFDTARTRATAHLLSQRVRMSPGTKEMTRIWLWAHLVGRIPAKYAAEFWAVQVPQRQGVLPVTTRRFIRAVRRAGMQVHVWVVNSEPDMHKLLERGVDALISDDAPLLQRVLTGYSTTD
ncbi:glycerophosphodiester phosphodiesterase family protein [Glutamicibacter uratoxydans]|uniref:glycerophosphodiester phosphodiesterase family protein n=1 Tax=Glutamicibacter uratoxydans TaxID=43667 RepID=UPI003D6DAC5B